jgi:hypothetical protein
MATRLIGTDSTDPWLPDIVKVKADKAKVVDAAGNFTATDVEAALAELAADIDTAVITGGGMPAANDAETIAGTITDKAVTPAGLKAARPYFDVRSYGAVGDGTTDDTTAIQATIDACNTAGGGVVAFPKGTFVISAALDMLNKTGVRLEGASLLATVIRQNTLTLPVVKVRGSYIGITDMQLRYVSQATNAAATAIELHGIVSFSEFRNLYMWYCNIGIAYGGAISPTGEFSNLFENIRIGLFNANGIKLIPTATSSTGSHWSNIYINNYTGSIAGVCTGQPLYLNQTSAVFNQLNIEWCDVVTANVSTCFLHQCSGVVINKLHIEGCKLAASKGFINTFGSGGCQVQVNGLDLLTNTAASGNVGIVHPGAANHVTISNVLVGANAGIAANFYAIFDTSVATNAVVIVDGVLDLTNVLDGFSLNYTGTAHARGYKGATAGFYGATPIVKPTGVAVTAAGIHAALVSLGLIGV